MIEAARHSEEAEQSVLGALMQDAEALEAVAGVVRPTDFFVGRHRALFALMQREALSRKPLDPISLAAAAQDADEIGGLSYLVALESSVPSARNAKRHAEIVRDRAQQRALLAAADEAMELARGDGGVAEKVEKIAALFGVLQRQQVAKLPRSIVDIAIERTQHYEDLQAGKVAPGWATRIPSLDSMLSGGLRPGGLYIVAARPKVGKSSFAQTLSMTMALSGLPTLFLSQEMADTELADRAVASTGRIDYSALLSGRMSSEDWGRASEALEAMKDAALYVDDQGGLTLLDIKAKVRTVPGLRVLVVDYLQLCASALSDSNRNAQIEELTRGMKAMAKQLGIAVIALSQLNRDVEKRATKRPQLSDLRDSGAIEQDADAVLFLWPVREAGDHKLVGLAVEANRQGRCGSFGLDFHGATQRWGESTQSIEAPAQSSGRRFE